MAGRGPAPKPAHLRQRTNKKAGIATLEAPAPDSVEVPEIPNPDARVWHPLTVQAWQRAWESPMSSQWLATDADALGRLALLWDQFYAKPGPGVMAEIRLQEQRFGFSPLDRSRLQWEIKRAADTKPKPEPGKRTGADPRALLMAVK
jgi:hypothetical protein